MKNSIKNSAQSWVRERHNPEFVTMRISDRKGGNLEEWPAYLRMQEWPAGF
jgi:hypothetical protein